MPIRLTFDISKINELHLPVTSSYDVQNFRTLYPRARIDEHYNSDVTHFLKIGAKIKYRIYANQPNWRLTINRKFTFMLINEIFVYDQLA